MGHGQKEVRLRRKSPSLLTRGEKDHSHVQAVTAKGWRWMGRVAKWPCLVQWAASVTHRELERTGVVFHKLTNWKWTEEPVPHHSPSTGKFIYLSTKMPEQVGT